MSPVDLSNLRMESPPAMPRRPLGPRLWAGAVLLLALAVAATFCWPLLRPVRAVPMAAVRATSATEQAARAIAEAAGWIEPDPFPVFVRPLVTGRLESIDVLEGSVVQRGTSVVAKLASAELLAAKERAGAALAERERQAAAAEAALAVAQSQLAQRGALRDAALQARLAAAEIEGRLAQARGAELRAAAAQSGAQAVLQGQRQLAAAGASYPVALARAEADAAAAAAEVEATQRQVVATSAELAAAEARRQLAEELLAAPVDLQGAVSLARAALERERAALASARTEAAIADRELAWATVVAPSDGVVMRLTSAPGALVGPDAEPILALYDPQHLRARIDVPLGAVAGIHDGQAVELRSEVLGNTVVHGVVQRVQRESDLLKNTLQVKVALQDPPPLLRPETLCRARFLGGAANEPAVAAATAFVLPRAALRDGQVFRFDPAARCARAVPVTVVQEHGDDVIVRGDLSATQRVILAPVQDGERVQEQQP